MASCPVAGPLSVHEHGMDAAEVAENLLVNAATVADVQLPSFAAAFFVAIAVVVAVVNSVAEVEVASFHSVAFASAACGFADLHLKHL